MRSYHFGLLALGLMAMTPAVTEAGWFGSKSEKPEATSKATNQNQQVAEQIGAALKSQNLKGHDISVKYERGVAVLTGYAPSQRHKDIVTKIVEKSSRSVKQVDNRMRVVAPRKPVAAKPVPRGGIQQASAEDMPQYGRVTRVPTSVPKASIRQVQGEMPPMQSAPGPMPPMQYSQGPMPPVQQVQGQMPVGQPIPSYGTMATPASHAVYDMPNLPQHAWPAYASHPNYAQVSYPKEYSASAWPYIGPFYPYPQVPLGWRKVQLEWDDGSWKLNFKPRTEKWWWFLNYKNW